MEKLYWEKQQKESNFSKKNNNIIIDYCMNKTKVFSTIIFPIIFLMIVNVYFYKR